MKYFLKLSTVFILLLAATTALGYFCWYLPKFKPVSKKEMTGIPVHNTSSAVMSKIKANLPSAKQKIAAGNFNSKHCFFIDMGIASGKRRFFVFNLEKDSIERSGLVAHGSGSDRDGSASYFSNKEGSNCTSLGKYRIGSSYHGTFGLAFKLHGLDKTNDHAYNRNVVLHAHSCVPNDDVSPLPICLSWGCPTVSPDFLLLLKKYIDESDKPMLLMIYK